MYRIESTDASYIYAPRQDTRKQQSDSGCWGQQRSGTSCLTGPKRCITPYNRSRRRNTHSRPPGKTCSRITGHDNWCASCLANTVGCWASKDGACKNRNERKEGNEDTNIHVLDLNSFSDNNPLNFIEWWLILRVKQKVKGYEHLFASSIEIGICHLFHMLVKVDVVFYPKWSLRPLACQAISCQR